MRPVVSLIVSSYNQPNALALVLEGVLTQTRPVDELVVADDGSEASPWQDIALKYPWAHWRSREIRLLFASPVW